MSVDTDPRLGTELAGYRIESLLGRGGMGVVYLATDERLKRRVALKLVAPELAADARFRERFLRESRLAASLDHSHVVPVHAAGETAGQLWIAMRYVQGTDLRTLLERKGPLEPARALELVGQIGEALDAAHAHGLVHRDVKPANVLVTEEGGREHSYLSDFGLARSPSEEHEVAPTHLSGTVDYTAPEQIAREPADHRADLYSLACVLYECLTGQPPFRRDRPAATLFAHVQEEPPRLTAARPELPRSLDQVLATALAKAPEDRYATCAQLVADARTALGLDERRFSRRTLLLAGGGAALAATAAAVVPALLLTGGSSKTAAPTPILPLRENSLARIDPATGQVTAATATGIRSGLVAVTGGKAWVADARTGEVARFDAATGRLADRIAPTAEYSYLEHYAGGADTVWFTTLDTTQGALHPKLFRYDQTTRTFVRYDAEGEYDFIGGLTIGLGKVWATGVQETGPLDPTDDHNRVLHVIAPRTGTTEAVLEGPWYNSHPVAAGDGRVWIFDSWAETPLGPGPFTLLSVDATALTIDGTYLLDFLTDSIVAGYGSVWVSHPEADAVARIDPATGQITDEIRVGRDPRRLALGAGAVWATSPRDGTVTRVDPVTSDIKTIDVGGEVTDVAVGAGAVWATVNAR